MKSRIHELQKRNFKKVSKKLSLLLSIAIATISCSKNDSQAPAQVPAKTQSELIIGKWEHTTDLLENNGSTITQNYGGNQAGCSKDFKTFSVGGLVDGDYVSNGGMCDLTETNRTWSIADNKIKIGSGTYSISILNETDFGYKTTGSSGSSQTFFMKKVN